MKELPAQHIQRSSKTHLNKWEHIGVISMRNAPLTPEGVFDGGWQAPPIRHAHTHTHTQWVLWLTEACSGFLAAKAPYSEL